MDKTEDFDDFKGKYLDINKEAIESAKTKNYNRGAISGAYNDQNDPSGERRDKYAELYYETLRNSKKEIIVDTISKNASVSSYDLVNGKSRFEPDYCIAESLQRLREGKNIQEHDIILIHHEAMEYDLMNSKGIKYDKAHREIEKLFDYGSALKRWISKSR